MIKTILCYALGLSMAVLALGAQSATPAKKAPVKKTAARKGAAKKPAATTVASTRGKNGKKGTPAPRTTWRNRQTAPSPERYKEIQDALVAKGYLKPEDTGGGWNQNSTDGLKRFQGEQNLDASGRINSLSLIALGLGPKHEATANKPAETPQDR